MPLCGIVFILLWIQYTFSVWRFICIFHQLYIVLRHYFFEYCLHFLFVPGMSQVFNINSHLSLYFLSCYSSVLLSNSFTFVFQFTVSLFTPFVLSFLPPFSQFLLCFPYISLFRVWWCIIYNLSSLFMFLPPPSSLSFSSSSSLPSTVLLPFSLYFCLTPYYLCFILHVCVSFSSLPLLFLPFLHPTFSLSFFSLGPLFLHPIYFFLFYFTLFITSVPSPLSFPWPCIIYFLSSISVYLQ